MGTGGTLAGVGMHLKERKRDVVIGIADPMGAALYNWYKHGVLKSEGSSITEGIGQGRVTANLEGAPVDEAFQITDQEAIPIVFELLGARRPADGHIDGRERGRRDSSGASARPRSHHRDHPVRRRTALCKPSLQSRIPALEKSAGAAVAGRTSSQIPVRTPLL